MWYSAEQWVYIALAVVTALTVTGTYFKAKQNK